MAEEQFLGEDQFIREDQSVYEQQFLKERPFQKEKLFLKGEAFLEEEAFLNEEASDGTQLLVVEKQERPVRVDQYVAKEIGRSRSFVQKLIREGNVLVNAAAVKVNFLLTGDETVSVTIPQSAEPDILAEDIPLDILYEDEDLLVVNKPKGMVVHPAAGHYSGTLVNALMFHCRGSLSGINGVMRPGIVHRIDRDTSGSLLVCKNDFAHNHIARQLKEHTITRRYRAIVHGNLKADTGVVDAPIGRHPVERKKMAVNERNGKPAVTHYEVLQRMSKYTYIECRLETGRTHQIRVHMSSIRHPILGDEVYGPAKCPINGLHGQALHAMTLGFSHPRTGEYLEFTAPLPAYFQELLAREGKSV